jgi:hypothetical protein
MVVDLITTNPAAAGTALAVCAIGLGVRMYQSGGTVEADIDGDGEPELSASSCGAEDSNQKKVSEIDSGGVSVASDYESETEDDISEDETTVEDVENETDPTPDEVAERENLADVNGIGPQRAEWLRGEGYETPADLYYATDENLEAVHGFGPKAVGHIRDDIGGVDMDESDAGNSEEQNDDTGQSSSEEETDPTSDTEGKTGGDSEEDVSEDETATTRNVEDEPTAEENDTENDT